MPTGTNSSGTLFTSPKAFFTEMVQKGFDRRKIDPVPDAVEYISNLLFFYVDIRNLYESSLDESGNRRPNTLAELFLTSQVAISPQRIELLKKLGDRALYISGFFGDSLNRSIVDLDYYYSMGTNAYSLLSSEAKEASVSRTYGLIAEKFVDYADVLTTISQESMISTDRSILRLYESYLRTGSTLAKERLTELGVVPITDTDLKKARQS